MSNAFALRPLVPTLVTASGTAAGYAAANVANDYAGIVWRSPTGANAYLIIDLGADILIDTVMLFGVKNAPAGAKLTVGAAVAATGGASYTDYSQVDLYAGSVTPRSGAGVALYRLDLNGAGAAVSARYFKLYFDSLGAGGNIQIARVVIGKRTALNRNFSFGAAFGVRDLGSFGFSPQGVMLRRRAAKLRTLGISFDNVKRDEVEGQVQPLIELSAGQEPVALCIDPDTSTERQNRCYFGPLIGDMGNIWRAAHAWVWRVNMIDLFAIPKAS